MLTDIGYGYAHAKTYATPIGYLGAPFPAYAGASANTRQASRRCLHLPRITNGVLGEQKLAITVDQIPAPKEKPFIKNTAQLKEHKEQQPGRLLAHHEFF